MKYIVLALLLNSCGSVYKIHNSQDADTVDNLSTKYDDRGTGGVSVDSGSGGSTGTGGLPADAITPGTGGMQGTGGSVQATGGNSGSGGTNGSGGSTPVNTACGLDLPTCPNTVKSIYFDMVYASPNNTSGPREARICAVNAKGVTVIDDKGTLDTVKCGGCLTGIANGKKGVYNCLVPSHTIINTYMSQPVLTDTAVYCLPPNGVCPDIGVRYTKWDGREFINGEQ